MWRQQQQSGGTFSNKSDVTQDSLLLQLVKSVHHADEMLRVVVQRCRDAAGILRAFGHHPRIILSSLSLRRLQATLIHLPDHTLTIITTPIHLPDHTLTIITNDVRIFEMSTNIRSFRILTVTNFLLI